MARPKRAADSHRTQGDAMRPIRLLLLAAAALGLAAGARAQTVYCTAKVNSLGCVPAIGFTGTPSKTFGTAFHITATNVLNGKDGLLFYGWNGQLANPF